MAIQAHQNNPIQHHTHKLHTLITQTKTQNVKHQGTKYKSSYSFSTKTLCSLNSRVFRKRLVEHNLGEVLNLNKIFAKRKMSFLPTIQVYPALRNAI